MLIISVLAMNRLNINLFAKVNGCASISSDFHPYLSVIVFSDVIKWIFNITISIFK